MFIEYLWQEPAFYFSWVLVVVFSICVHEYTHAWMACQQGDETARSHGFLTLDPRRVMGVQSLVALALFGIAWGAVPVDPRRFRHTLGNVLVSLSGPLANAALAVFFAVALTACRFLPASLPEGLYHATVLFTNVGVQANSLLLVFNLLPIPMLDGWAAAEAMCPPLRRLTAEQRGTYSLVAILLIWFSPLKSVVFRLSGLFQAIILGAIDAVLTLFNLA
ncbi:MAG: site-2 protease family protein [Lentisphaeria bacterium]|jgi:Zn-dependent protease|nr:site-2 protease family protein [Lentisphaeria bacterium]